MSAFVLLVEIDKEEDRGKVAVVLRPITKCVLTIVPVSGCGQEHGHTILLSWSEERHVHIWQATPSIEGIVKRPWDIGSNFSIHGEAVDARTIKATFGEIKWSSTRIASFKIEQNSRP